MCATIFCDAGGPHWYCEWECSCWNLMTACRGECGGSALFSVRRDAALLAYGVCVVLFPGSRCWASYLPHVFWAGGGGAEGLHSCPSRLGLRACFFVCWCVRFIKTYVCRSACTFGACGLFGPMSVGRHALLSADTTSPPHVAWEPACNVLELITPFPASRHKVRLTWQYQAGFRVSKPLSVTRGSITLWLCPLACADEGGIYASRTASPITYSQPHHVQSAPSATAPEPFFPRIVTRRQATAPMNNTHEPIGRRPISCTAVRQLPTPSMGLLIGAFAGAPYQVSHTVFSFARGQCAVCACWRRVGPPAVQIEGCKPTSRMGVVLSVCNKHVYALAWPQTPPRAPTTCAYGFACSGLGSKGVPQTPHPTSSPFSLCLLQQRQSTDKQRPSVLPPASSACLSPRRV